MGAIITQSMGSEYGTPVQHFHRLLGELSTLQFFVGMPAVKRRCAWMQLAVLCDHTTTTVLRAMKGAIHRVCSRGPWCVDATIFWAVVQARHLPTSASCSAGLLQTWLKREAFWHDGKYVSWHAPHSGKCSATCAPWDADFDILSDI